jgi:molybdate transport system substrate-binding protein
LLRAANVSQAYQMWFSGGADAALVGLSFDPLRYLSIDPGDYPPLQQQAVLLKNAVGKPAATDFMNYLQSSAARQLIEEHGYATAVADHD